MEGEKTQLLQQHETQQPQHLQQHPQASQQPQLPRVPSMHDPEKIPKTWIRRGVMQKRAQGTGKLSRMNFKRRTFILTEESLNYYEGTDLASLKLKGRVPVRDIRAVENVDKAAFDRSAMFQVVHDQAILYVDAEKQVDRADWVDAIRKACQMDQNVTSKHQQYHSGIFTKGHWTCCNLDRPTGGCKRAFQYYSSHPTETPVVSIAPAAASREIYVQDEDFDDDSEIDPDELADARLAALPMGSITKEQFQRTRQSDSPTMEPLAMQLSRAASVSSVAQHDANPAALTTPAPPVGLAAPAPRASLAPSNSVRSTTSAASAAPSDAANRNGLFATPRPKQLPQNRESPAQAIPPAQAKPAPSPSRAPAAPPVPDRDGKPKPKDAGYIVADQTRVEPSNHGYDLESAGPAPGPAAAAAAAGHALEPQSVYDSAALPVQSKAPAGTDAPGASGGEGHYQRISSVSSRDRPAPSGTTYAKLDRVKRYEQKNMPTPAEEDTDYATVRH